MYPEQLVEIRQIIWTLAHAPLHLALMMLVEGTNQFIIFWKVTESTFAATDRMLGAADPLPSNATVGQVANVFNKTAYDILDQYHPIHERQTYGTIDGAILNLTATPDLPWSDLDDGNTPVNDTLANALNQIGIIISSVLNAIYARYNIDGMDDIPPGTHAGEAQRIALTNVWNRFELMV